MAAASYRNGRFWPGWHRAAGLRATRRSAEHWGQAFVEALTVLGITPPGAGWEAVLVHAAVPDACVPEFLHLVAAGCKAGGADAGADLSGTDPAIAALLRSGGPAVTSFIERCRSTLRLMTGLDRPADGDHPAGDQSLPRRILDAAELVAAELGRGPAPARVLRLEPFGRGVLVADGGDQTWRSALPLEVADPLLVFDEGGGHVGSVLPAEPVWVVHPDGLALCSDVPPREMVISRLPLTWRGWRMAQLDLRGVSWLELEIPDKTARRHGLEPAEAALTAPAGMTISPQAAYIPAESVTIGMTCVAGPIIVALRVRPPHLRMRIEPEPGGGGKPTTRSTTVRSTGTPSRSRSPRASTPPSGPGSRRPVSSSGSWPARSMSCPAPPPSSWAWTSAR